MIKIPKGVFKYKSLNDDLLIINSKEKEKTYCLGLEFGEIILQWIFNISVHADPTYKLVKIPLKEAQIGKFYFNGLLIDNDEVTYKKYLKNIQSYYLYIGKTEYDEHTFVNYTDNKCYYIEQFDISSDDNNYVWEVRRV